MGDLVGRRIAHFRIEAKLGEGGMGIVYRAFDEKLRRPVALKVLPEKQTADEEARKRLLREARAAAAVTHPNLVGVYDVGEEEGHVFVAMELIEGETLRDRLERGPLRVPEALGIAAKIAAGLERIHEAGIVHRDLKPDNVMLTRQGQVKILDFGLARGFVVEGTGLLGHQKTVAPLTAEGILVGTPGYMSPEQLEGESLDGRSDLFSFGVMLYEILTGVLPFQGRTNASIVIAIAKQDPEPPSTHNPEVSADLDAVVLWCLAKKPAERCASAREVREDLEALIPPSDPSEPRISRAPLRPSRSLPPKEGLASRLAPLAALVLVVVGISALARRTGEGSKAAAAPKSEPSSPSAQAASAYAAGMQALHDDNWYLAQRSLSRAVELDPEMAEAQLKLAAVLGVDAWSSVDAREAFAKAVAMRSRLSERDREFMSALAPLLQESPPDVPEATTRLEAATRRYPDDADLLAWLAYAELAHPERAMEAASRALTLDRTDANAWEVRGRALASLGRMDEAIATFEECATISLETTDCLYWAGAVAEVEGRCSDAERLYRRSLNRDPRQGFLYLYVGEMLFAKGEPLARVRETVAPAAALAGTDEDRFLVSAFPANLAFAMGDFETARTLVQEILEAETTTDYQAHLRPAVELAELALEMGDEGEARRVVGDFAARRATWTFTDEATGSDLTPWIFRYAYSPPNDTTSVQDWVDTALRSGVAPGRAWTYGFAASARTRAQAVEALSVLPNYAPLTFFDPPFNGVPDAHVGHAYFLAGRFDEAAPLLERAVKNCRVVSWPYEHARAAWELGQLREQRGERAGACAAYATILKNWGNAKPRSVTGERARQRATALGCP
jgi:eukaryotic-like serine/threonine-protein kinase